MTGPGPRGKSYSCRHCKTSIALCDDVVSKSFQSRHGKAYLFSKVANVYAGKKEDRMMMTGMHTVVDIYCVKCGSYVGWRYEFAFEKNQKYKEGKSVLERSVQGLRSGWEQLLGGGSRS
ncbi:hypothetical protein Bca4012_074572 [Brassica carinata]